MFEADDLVLRGRFSVIWARLEASFARALTSSGGFIPKRHASAQSAYRQPSHYLTSSEAKADEYISSTILHYSTTDLMCCADMTSSGPLIPVILILIPPRHLSLPDQQFIRAVIDFCQQVELFLGLLRETTRSVTLQVVPQPLDSEEYLETGIFPGSHRASFDSESELDEGGNTVTGEMRSGSYFLRNAFDRQVEVGESHRLILDHTESLREDRTDIDPLYLTLSFGRVLEQSDHVDELRSGRLVGGK